MAWALITLAVLAVLREAHWQLFAKDVQRVAERMERNIASRQSADPDSGKAGVA